jgi:hypothetical protein
MLPVPLPAAAPNTSSKGLKGSAAAAVEGGLTAKAGAPGGELGAQPPFVGGTPGGKTEALFICTAEGMFQAVLLLLLAMLLLAPNTGDCWLCCGDQASKPLLSKALLVVVTGVGANVGVSVTLHPPLLLTLVLVAVVAPANRPDTCASLVSQALLLLLLLALVLLLLPPKAAKAPKLSVSLGSHAVIVLLLLLLVTCLLLLLLLLPLGLPGLLVLSGDAVSSPSLSYSSRPLPLICSTQQQ